MTTEETEQSVILSKQLSGYMATIQACDTVNKLHLVWKENYTDMKKLPADMFKQLSDLKDHLKKNLKK